MPDYVSSASQPKRKTKLAVNRLEGLLWPIIIVTGVVVIDQVTKYWAVTALTGRPPLRMIGDLLMLTLVYNKGGAMGSNLGSSSYYLVVSIVVLPFLLYYVYHHRREASLAWPLAFIAGGAIGNLIDRIRLGQVTDFIDVDFFDMNLFGFRLERWWTFNLADACISVAIIFLLLRVLFWHRRKTPRPSETTI